jgi:anthranilate/para-aminobenzoate synthase component I
MEIIAELEPTRRGLYTGSLGYVSFSGALELSIAIRTFVVKGGRAFFQAGAGIVADSDPEREYEETLQKALGMAAAL